MQLACTLHFAHCTWAGQRQEPKTRRRFTGEEKRKTENEGEQHNHNHNHNTTQQHDTTTRQTQYSGQQRENCANNADNTNVKSPTFTLITPLLPISPPLPSLPLLLHLRYYTYCHQYIDSTGGFVRPFSYPPLAPPPPLLSSPLQARHRNIIHSARDREHLDSEHHYYSNNNAALPQPIALLAHLYGLIGWLSVCLVSLTLSLRIP